MSGSYTASKNEGEHDRQSVFNRARKMKKRLLEGKENKKFHIKDKRQQLCSIYLRKHGCIEDLSCSKKNKVIL